MRALPTRDRVVVGGFIGLVIGALAGVWFGSTLRGSNRALSVDEPSAVSNEPALVVDSPLDAPAPDRRASNAALTVTPDASICPLFGEVQREHGEAGIRANWKRLRQDEVSAAELAAGLAQYEGLVRNSPNSIGVTLANARTASDAALADAERGGLFALLDALDKKDAGPIVDVVRDAKQLDAFFQRSSTGNAFVDGASNRAHPDKALTDGATLTFPAGVFQIGALMRESDPFPSDVTVSGAGMSATLLVMSSALSTNGELVNLTVRDCTIHTNVHYLTDLRSNPASMTFERVRFVGFDMGAGASCLFAAKTAAIRAFDCQFLGGYGRSPSSGSILDVRSNGLLARFEACRFDQVSLRPHGLGSGATVVLIRCALTDILDGYLLESHGLAGLALDQCTVGYIEGGAQSAQARDLNELFPDWKARMER